MALSILGMGAAHPETVIDNDFLVGLGTDSSAEWIVEKIGIITRLTSLPLDYIATTKNQDPSQAMKVSSVSPADLGVIAAKQALDSAEVTPQQIGLVITNCCSADSTAPTEAQLIASRLGITSPAYDVFSACPAFALHMNYLNEFKPEALPDYILCVITATLTHRVNYNDRTDAAIWGDGAAAYIVSPRKKGKLSVLNTAFTADPSRAEAVVVDRFSFFHQDGRAVRDFSVRQTVRTIKGLEEKFNLNWSNDIFIGHQANRTMLAQITGNREIPESNHWHNVAQVGNQAGAGAPAVLSAHWDEVRSGQRVVVAVLGAGLSWGSIVFECQ